MWTFTAIVPTLDEEADVQGALLSARRALGPDAQLLVVDGGSRDRTRERARPLARVLDSAPGRGRQLRRGVRAARGHALVFLHADTRLLPGSGRAMADALTSGAGAGCHRFALLGPRTPARRFVEAAVNLRTRVLRTATGDQAIFCTRKALEGAGGVPQMPLFEDIELVRRLRRVAPFRVLELAAPTSPRRWEARGYARTVIEHLALRAAWRAGIPAERLAAWYGRGLRD